MKWPWVCALAALGCGGAASEGGGRATAPLEPTTRDSAGVTIHEHAADALERAPLITMDSVPLATFIGDPLDPSKDVSTIWYLTFTTAGDLVGFESGERQFAVMRLSDHSQRRYSRRGSGPLELGYVRDFVALPGDSVIFADQTNNRLVITHPDHGVVRTISFSDVGRLPGRTLLDRVGDSVVLLASAFRPPTQGAPPSGLVPQSVTFATWRIGADSVRDVATVAAPPMFQVVRNAGAPGAWVMTGRGLLLEGGANTAGWRSGFAVVSGSQWQVQQWDNTGRLEVVVRVARSPRQVTEELFNHAVDQEVEDGARYDSTRNADSARAAIRALPRAETVAAFEGVYATPQGRLWLLDYRIPGDSGWAATLLDRDGRILGRIVEPSGDPPTAFGNDRLAFRTEDDDGIATITVRRIGVPR